MSGDPQIAAELLYNLLSPDVLVATKQIENGTKQLVHYTTAENALNIIKSRQFWLRNVRCMEDYSEVQHGINLLVRIFSDNNYSRRDHILNIFDQIAEGAARSALAAFDEWMKRLPDCTWIGCLSEHDPSDSLGRLSMWRAYSTTRAGVALIMNPHPFIARSNELKAYSVPVSYLSDTQFSEKIDSSLLHIEENLNGLQCLNSESITYIVFWWLLASAVSLKHPAFIEEREWRIVYFPDMEKSPSILNSVECIRGIPQVVQKIPLINDLDGGLDRADLDNLLFKLLVGPSEFPLSLKDAFVEALGEQGVQEPEERVSISFIPLRQVA